MMKRKNFFSAIGLGILGVAFTSFSPLKLISRNRKFNEQVKVNINPLAIKRIGTKEKNV